jgi:Mg-chelatase subunit ChlD
MSRTRLVSVLLGIAFFSLQPLATYGDCPGNLNDRADVATNPSTNNYDVYYTDDSVTSVDYFSQTSAQWARDALLNAHNVFVSGTHNFQHPYFNDSPNDTCIYDSKNIGTAPHGRITLDAPSLRAAAEPYLRAILAHELFHHVQFNYIDFNEWPSWGTWTVEGTARAMEDKLWLDNDTTPANTLYVGEINDYLGNPNRTLFDISYTAALFWTYLCEQLGTPFPEPARGVDVIQRFWANTEGNDPDGLHYLKETIRSFSSGATFEGMFRDFCIANYTHDLDVSGLSNPDRYRYFDESAAGGNTPYNAVARTAVASWNTTFSDQVVRWGARYFEIDVSNEKRCEAIGFWGKAKEGQTLSWAIMGIRGNQVIDVYHASGSTFYRSLINPPRGLYDKIAAVVIGLNKGSDFDYAFGWGAVSGEIRYPTLNRMAYVGTRTQPERFQARLRLLGPAVLTPPGSGSPSIKGLDPTDFGVTLASASTGVEYPATVINGNYVSGEYWLTVQAPEITDPADGDLYDLEICFCSDGGTCASNLTSSKSVLYAKITKNQMLVLDRSYSMHYPESDPKIEAAKNAARVYVNAAADDDRMGLVTFNGNDSECDDDAQLEQALASVSGSRGMLITEINAVVEDGWTSIGDGIKKGRDQLFTVGSPADVRSIVLLSDGKENEGDFWAKSNSACSTPAVRNSFDPATGWAAGVRIDSVAFGPETNQELLQSIAVYTDGDYYAVSSDPPMTTSSALSARFGGFASAAMSAPSSASLEVSNRLAQVYRSIEEEVHRQDRLFYTAVRIPAGGAASVPIPVTEREGGGVREAVFAFNWNRDIGVSVNLFDPGHNPISGGLSGWQVFTDKTNKAYHYEKTLPAGEWLAEIRADEDVEVLCMLSGKMVRGVDIDLHFSQIPGHNLSCDEMPISTYLRGLPVTVFVNLNDSLGGVSELNVEAEVQNPDGSINRLSLFDDGDHDDGLPGDGIYGNAYTRTPFFSQGGGSDFPPFTGIFGSYTVAVTVEGENNYRERFQRYISRCFQVYEYVGQKCDPDLDGDGLPDRWEDFYGLDKTNPSDAGLDNDRDGLKNSEEFFYGTHPFDPDTDKGGESDGSEVNNGRDPLYDKDDLLPAIVDYGVVTQLTDIPIHEPRPNTNILHFPVNSAYRYMQIWRRDPLSIGFTRVARLDLSARPNGVYYDKGLTNGSTYWYYLVAEGLSGAKSAPTEFFSGTPKADPLPPKGWIKINHGASQTDSLNVYLHLDTSDDAVRVKVSMDPAFKGVSWRALRPEIAFTLNPGSDPFLATVYAKFMDLAGNESIVYSASIIVDRYGDNDGDGIRNELDPDDDNDGLSDALEITATDILRPGYDPFKPDTDGNGTKDGDEDQDRDLLSNLYELKYGTDPAHHLSDMNGDDALNQTDVDLFLWYFEANDPRADVNGDGWINDRDTTAFWSAYYNERNYSTIRKAMPWLMLLLLDEKD